MQICSRQIDTKKFEEKRREMISLCLLLKVYSGKNVRNIFEILLKERHSKCLLMNTSNFYVFKIFSPDLYELIITVI